MRNCKETNFMEIVAIFADYEIPVVTSITVFGG